VVISCYSGSLDPTVGENPTPYTFTKANKLYIHTYVQKITSNTDDAKYYRFNFEA